jgi:hypothetical protein
MATWTASIESASDGGPGKEETLRSPALREMTSWAGNSVYVYLQTHALDRTGLALALLTVIVQLCSYAVFFHESIVCLLGLAQCSLQGGIVKVEGLANLTSFKGELPKITLRCVAALARSSSRSFRCLPSLTPRSNQVDVKVIALAILIAVSWVSDDVVKGVYALRSGFWLMGTVQVVMVSARPDKSWALCCKASSPNLT